jgi:hypothetical protein
MESALKKMKVLKNGYYTLFENVYNRRILVLDGEEWYVWINEDLGPTLIFSEPFSVQKRSDYKIIMQGRFFLENLEEDPLMPHLLLQDDNVYLEIVLPQGLPSRIDPSKSMIINDQELPKEYVENFNESILPSHQ